MSALVPASVALDQARELASLRERVRDLERNRGALLSVLTRFLRRDGHTLDCPALTPDDAGAVCEAEWRCLAVRSVLAELPGLHRYDVRFDVTFGGHWSIYDRELRAAIIRAHGVRGEAQCRRVAELLNHA